MSKTDVEKLLLDLNEGRILTQQTFEGLDVDIYWMNGMPLHLPMSGCRLLNDVFKVLRWRRSRCRVHAGNRRSNETLAYRRILSYRDM